MPIHPNTSIGATHLVVANLEESLRFYREMLGFKVSFQDGDTATLSADGQTPLLRLTGRQDATPRPPGTTGLYHFAILVPTRADLGRSLQRLMDLGYPLQGAADHLVSEALYLGDPDDNGIEIYRDRPRQEWPMEGREVRMANAPFDFEGILADAANEGGEWSGLAHGTRIGHVHLQVGDIRGAEQFYAGVLGFEVMQRWAGAALFVGAGGYHHHIGLNTWAGVGAPPPPETATGLRHFTVLLPGEAALSEVVNRLKEAGVSQEADAQEVSLKDPWGNGILLQLAGNDPRL